MQNRVMRSMPRYFCWVILHRRVLRSAGSGEFLALLRTGQPPSIISRIMLFKCGLENQTEIQECFKPEGLADISASSEPHGIALVPICIGRAENHDGQMAASLAPTHTFQYLIAILFRQV